MFGQLYSLIALFKISNDHSEIDKPFEGIYIFCFVYRVHLPAFLQVHLCLFSKTACDIKSENKRKCFYMQQGYLIYFAFYFSLACMLKMRKCSVSQNGSKFKPNTRVSNYVPKYGFRKKSSLTVKGDEHLLLPQICHPYVLRPMKEQLQQQVWIGFVECPGSLSSLLLQIPSAFSK